MVRPFRPEVERDDEYFKAGEFVYDNPFLWGQSVQVQSYIESE
jgi:cbb3-type cytochrome oxidase cytochrome c subunit